MIIMMVFVVSVLRVDGGHREYGDHDGHCCTDHQDLD